MAGVKGQKWGVKMPEEQRQANAKAASKRAYERAKLDPEKMARWNLCSKASYQRNKKEMNKRSGEKQKLRKQTDPEFKLKAQIRSKVCTLIRGTQKSYTALEALGCPVEEVMAEIAAKFQPGMTWENWGKHTWHIDHVKPLSAFNLLDPVQMKAAWHYTNLEPKWAKDNLSKWCRFTPEDERRYYHERAYPDNF